MEGMHLDPSLYLYEFARFGQSHLKASAVHSGDSVPVGVSELASPAVEEAASNAVPDAEDSDQDLLRWLPFFSFC